MLLIFFLSKLVIRFILRSEIRKDAPSLLYIFTDIIPFHNPSLNLLLNESLNLYLQNPAQNQKKISDSRQGRQSSHDEQKDEKKDKIIPFKKSIFLLLTSFSSQLESNSIIRTLIPCSFQPENQKILFSPDISSHRYLTIAFRPADCRRGRNKSRRQASPFLRFTMSFRFREFVSATATRRNGTMRWMEEPEKQRFVTRASSYRGEEEGAPGEGEAMDVGRWPE